MKTKTFEIQTQTICKQGDFTCSNNIIEKLKPLGLKLMAANPTDIVNGFVSIDHRPNHHLIRIEIYTENEAPSSHHSSTLEKPITVPSENQIKSLLL